MQLADAAGDYKGMERRGGSVKLEGRVSCGSHAVGGWGAARMPILCTKKLMHRLPHEKQIIGFTCGL